MLEEKSAPPPDYTIFVIKSTEYIFRDQFHMLMTAHLGHFFSAPVLYNSFCLSVSLSVLILLRAYVSVCHRLKVILFSFETARRTSFLNHNIDNLTTVLKLLISESR